MQELTSADFSFSSTRGPKSVSTICVRKKASTSSAVCLSGKKVKPIATSVVTVYLICVMTNA